jgi:hypothetical protein
MNSKAVATASVADHNKVYVTARLARGGLWVGCVHAEIEMAAL